MAAFAQRKDDEVISSINIIPFVDIVLVLLIIFMVTSTAIVKAAIKVELPTAAQAGSEVAATVNLIFTAERELLIDGELIAADRAPSTLKALASANPELQAVISADKSIPYGEVVEIIDMVKGAGVVTFALNIERKTRAS